MRIEGEGAGDEGVEARVHRFARRGDQVDARERAEFGTDEDRGAPLRLALHEAPLRPDIFAGPGRQRGKADRVALLGLVDAGGAQMLQHHCCEVGRRHDLVQAPAHVVVGVHEVDQLRLVAGNDAMRRQALDRERPGDAHSRFVFIGAVVAQFDVGGLGDRGVDLLLTGYAALPPLRMGLLRGGGPCRRSLARDFPVLECLAERGVQLRAQRLQLRLPLLVDDVYLGIICNISQRDVRRSLVDEAQAEVLMGRSVRQEFAGDVLLFATPFNTIGQQVIGIARAHQPSARERERDTRGVDRDPAAAPLLGDIGRRARTAGRIKHKVTGVCRHQDATLNDIGGSLNNIDFCFSKTSRSNIVPIVSYPDNRIVICIHSITQVITYNAESTCFIESVESSLCCAPKISLKRFKVLSLKVVFVTCGLSTTVGIYA